jgi:ABC-type uncharacterized transport system substrate-binding protein
MLRYAVGSPPKSLTGDHVLDCALYAGTGDRWADGHYERLPGLAAELVRLNVDVVVTSGTPGIRAAKGATTTIPIVMATVGDAVLVGLVASLARPGGNITGSTFFNPELAAKRLELLKETLPRLTRVAALINHDNPGQGTLLQAMEPTAKSLKLELQVTRTWKAFQKREPIRSPEAGDGHRTPSAAPAPLEFQ